MARLAEDYDYVLGGDPDRDSVDVVVVKAATGGVLAPVSDRADEDGYTRLLAWARTRGAKSDRIDAARAAGVALGRERQTAPRARGLREALRQIVTTRHGVWS